MTIAGVHDTTLNTGIMSGPISRLGIRQHSPAMQSAECGVHYWDYTGRHQLPVSGPSVQEYCHMIPCLWDNFYFLFAGVCWLWCEARTPLASVPVCPEPVVSGLNFIRYSTGNQDTAPAASSWDPSDHQTVEGLFSFIIFLKMEERM